MSFGKRGRNLFELFGFILISSVSPPPTYLSETTLLIILESSHYFLKI